MTKLEGKVLLEVLEHIGKAQTSLMDLNQTRIDANYEIEYDKIKTLISQSMKNVIQAKEWLDALMTDEDCCCE